ncbi:MAG: hypothetical protein RR528_02810, partial [Angelakisella sp.]
MNWLERVRTIFNDKEQAWAVKDDMKDQISRWGRLYRQGSLHGTGSLRLPAAIASELARLAVCELETRLTGGVRAE